MIDRIVRAKDVCEMVQFTNTHLRRLEERGEFPPRFKLANDSGAYGAVGWRLSDIMNWIEKRAATAHSA